MKIISVADALILHVESRSSASLPRWSSNRLWATRSLTSASTDDCLVLAVDVVRLIWALTN